jgi:hypothetical protein
LNQVVVFQLQDVVEFHEGPKPIVEVSDLIRSGLKRIADAEKASFLVLGELLLYWDDKVINQLPSVPINCAEIGDAIFCLS